MNMLAETPEVAKIVGEAAQTVNQEITQEAADVMRGITGKVPKTAQDIGGIVNELTPATPEVTNVTLYRGEPVGVRPSEGNVPFTPDLAVAQGWAGGTGKVVQITLPRTEFDKLQFQKLPDRIATYFVPQEVYTKATPKAEVSMAPSTSVQTGLPGMEKPAKYPATQAGVDGSSPNW